MMSQSLPCNRFPFGTRLAIIAVWVDRNTASGQKLSPNFNVKRIHQLDQIVHDNIHTVLVKITVIAKTEQV